MKFLLLVQFLFLVGPTWVDASLFGHVGGFVRPEKRRGVSTISRGGGSSNKQKIGFLSVPQWAAKNSKSSSSPTKDAKVLLNDNLKEWTKPRTLMVSRAWTRTLYAISALNPFIAVIFNDYKKMLEPIPHLQTQNTHIIAQAYDQLFYFAKLKPRVSFAIGGMLRALQLSTAFRYVIDPSAGVGFGLNLICLYAKSRWPATIFLGWCITEPLWKLLGAHPPPLSAVPIAPVFPKKNEDDTSNSPGYRIGLGGSSSSHT